MLINISSMSKSKILYPSCLSFWVLGLRNNLYCFSKQMKKLALKRFAGRQAVRKDAPKACRKSFQILGKPFSSVIQKPEISNKTGISSKKKGAPCIPLPYLRAGGLFLLCFFCGLGWGANRLILSPGESLTLPLGANKTIRIGDKSLASLRELPDEGRFSLLAKKEGQTLLVVGQIRYELFIFQAQTKAKALLLDQLIKNCWGLRWSLDKEAGFSVTGRLNRLHDWLDIAQLAKKHNITYQFKAFVEDSLKQTAEPYFKSLFKSVSPPDILYDDLPVALFPQGAEAPLYETALRPFGLKARPDPSWPAKAPFIEIEIALMESLSSESSHFGGTGGQDTSPISLLSFLNFMKSKGWGKTLSHSMLVGQSGQSLKIQSGGQIPFASYNAKTEQSSTHWKSYGLSLDITPRQGKKRRIVMDIKAQFSEPLPTGPGSSPPPLKTQSVNSRVVLRDGEIVRLFKINKQASGVSDRGSLSALNPLAGLMFNGEQTYQTGRFVFLQARILKSQEKTPALKKQGAIKKAP